MVLAAGAVGDDEFGKAGPDGGRLSGVRGVPFAAGLARGLLLGCLVRVQVAEEVLLHEPLEAWS
jgi:hypothetical protein